MIWLEDCSLRPAPPAPPPKLRVFTASHFRELPPHTPGLLGTVAQVVHCSSGSAEGMMGTEMFTKPKARVCPEETIL